MILWIQIKPYRRVQWLTILRIFLNWVKISNSIVLKVTLISLQCYLYIHLRFSLHVCFGINISIERKTRLKIQQFWKKYYNKVFKSSISVRTKDTNFKVTQNFWIYINFHHTFCKKNVSTSVIKFWKALLINSYPVSQKYLRASICLRRDNTD